MNSAIELSPGWAFVMLATFAVCSYILLQSLVASCLSLGTSFRSKGRDSDASDPDTFSVGAHHPAVLASQHLFHRFVSAGVLFRALHAVLVGVLAGHMVATYWWHDSEAALGLLLPAALLVILYGLVRNADIFLFWRTMTQHLSRSRVELEAVKVSATPSLFSSEFSGLVATSRIRRVNLAPLIGALGVGVGWFLESVWPIAWISLSFSGFTQALFGGAAFLCLLHIISLIHIDLRLYDLSREPPSSS